MLSSLVRLTDDAAGLEKTLRLFQYTFTAIVGSTGSSEFAQARSHFALARRYFRLLKWQPCWVVAYNCLSKDEATIAKLLEVSKWSFLGLYFFLEMFTILNALGMTNYEWGPRVQTEANKCWFYAIAASILLSLYQLMTLSSIQPAASAGKESEKTPEVDKKESKSMQLEGTQQAARRKIYSQLVIDCADIIIPAAGVGWIQVDELTVGIVGTVSTIVAGQSIWARVQAAT